MPHDPLTPENLDEIEQRAAKATPGPWFWNSYSRICSAPLIQVDHDGPDYPDVPRPGPPFFTDEDNAWLAQRQAAYAADSTVAHVPALYGDTATGRHAADATFIAAARVDVPRLVAEVRRLRSLIAGALGDLDRRDEITAGDVLKRA